MRVRVPRRGTGAEQPVDARKSRNGDGAKGLYRSALLDGQPAMGGTIESSKAMKLWLVDRSRMSREVHVRICEGVGVRFPHATRPRTFYPAGQANKAAYQSGNRVPCHSRRCYVHGPLFFPG